MTRSWSTAPDPRLTNPTDRTLTMHLVARRSAVTAVATGCALVAVSGVGYAFWSTTGTGSGAASAGSSQPLTTGTATVTPGQQLFPGGSVTGTIVITNPNPFVVKVVAADFEAPTVSGVTGCTTSGVTFTASPAPSVTSPLTVPGSGTATLTYTASMDNSSLTECQGGTFTAALTLSGQS